MTPMINQSIASAKEPAGKFRTDVKNTGGELNGNVLDTGDEKVEITSDSLLL